MVYTDLMRNAFPRRSTRPLSTSAWSPPLRWWLSAVQWRMWVFRDFAIEQDVEKLLRTPRKKQLRLTQVERDRIKGKLVGILTGRSMTLCELQKVLLHEGLVLEVQFIRRLLRETGGYVETTSRRGTLWQRR